MFRNIKILNVGLDTLMTSNNKSSLYDFTFYPLNISYCGEDHPPRNAMDIITVLERVGFEISFSPDYQDESFEDYTKKLIENFPPLSDSPFHIPSHLESNLYTIIFSSNFAVELVVYSEHLMYGDETYYIKITGFSMNQTTVLKDIIPYIEMLISLNSIDID